MHCRRRFIVVIMLIWHTLYPFCTKTREIEYLFYTQFTCVFLSFETAVLLMVIGKLGFATVCASFDR